MDCESRRFRYTEEIKEFLFVVGVKKKVYEKILSRLDTQSITSKNIVVSVIVIEDNRIVIKTPYVFTVGYNKRPSIQGFNLFTIGIDKEILR